jgi:predicted nuclease of predicted toxin-antitoxin system
VKLLFDHNLSYRLARVLLDVYPESVDVRELLLERAPDEAIWNYARTHHLAIVSKDSDFHQRSVVEKALTIA